MSIDIDMDRASDAHYSRHYIVTDYGDKVGLEEVLTVCDRASDGGHSWSRWMLLRREEWAAVLPALTKILGASVAADKVLG